MNIQVNTNNHNGHVNGHWAAVTCCPATATQGAPLVKPARQVPLSDIARLGLTAGRMLLETGANGRVVHEAITDIVRGLGGDAVEVMCQHAAVLVMLRRGSESCMQMIKVGEHGVNLRRAQAVQEIVRRVRVGELDCADAQAALDQVPATTAAYPLWFVCLATGLACSAFGRLLGADWASFVPTLLGTAAGQWTRHTLLSRRHNIFVTAGLVSFVSAFLAGWGARLAGSTQVPLAMIAAVLLLVPGVAVLNTQVDVLEGKPSLASARALRVMYLLVFMSLGLAVAQTILRP